MREGNKNKGSYGRILWFGPRVRTERGGGDKKHQKKKGPGRDLNPGPLAIHIKLSRYEKAALKRESYH